MKRNSINSLHLFCLMLLVAFSQVVQGLTVVHQKGEFYGAEAYLTNEYGMLMQKTNTCRTIVYVNPTATSSTLVLPATTGNSPHFYYRWYDYKTDGYTSTRLTPVGTGGSATTCTNGIVAYGNSGSIRLESATYKPSGSTLPDFISCDVSSNLDFSLSGSNLTEPTISYRYIYEIRSANEIATQLNSCMGATFLENYTVEMPATKLANVKDFPRVALKYNATNYWGYNESGVLVQGSNSNFTLTNTNSQFVSGGNIRYCYVTPRTAGTSLIVTATIKCGTKVYNVAKFTITFTSDTPDYFSNLTGAKENRSINYLDNNYILLSKLDFDYNTDPVTAANNMWTDPLPWNNCTYGFASPTLFDKGQRGFGRVALWNEYGFYKSANVSGITSNYTWWNNGNIVYDRTHFISGGTKDGYFMYVDASEVPGIISKLELDKLCPGTKLFVSVGLSSLSYSSQSTNSDPNINLVFIGVDADGKETELNRYTSGDIPQAENTAATNPSPWWQLYYTFTFNSNVDYASYRLQLENNCKGTYGGDYAIDDIRIYRTKPSVQANQVTLPCGVEAAKVKINIEYGKLLENLSKTEVTSGSGTTFDVRYRFLDDSKNSIVYNFNTDGAPDTDYGVIRVSTKFSDMTALTSSNEAPITYSQTPALAYTESKTIDGQVVRFICFQTPNNDVLEPNKAYYTVIANSGGVFGTGMCDMVSEPFIIEPPSKVTVDGASWNNVNGGMCYGNTMTLGASLRDRITHEAIKCRFDWYIGTKTEFESILYNGMTASTALGLYRTAYPIPAVGDGLKSVSGVFTQQAYDLLAVLISQKKLILNVEEISRIVRYGELYLAIPIALTASPTATTTVLELCTDYVTIDAVAPHINPSIQINAGGFETPMTLRMGFSQFNDLKANSTKILTVPILDFKNSDQTKIRDLVKASDANVYLIATDDPSIIVDSLNPIIKVATIEAINATVVTSDVDYIKLKIPATSINMKEGYTYRMQFDFNQVQLAHDAVPCDGTALMTFKIVPEFVTWTGSGGDNWNKDENWKRSVKSELYKGSTYTDDANSHGFVPMKFSKATIANTTKAPWLYDLASSVNLDNTNYTDATNKKANAVTVNILNDLMVKANGSDYDSESFYGNTCDQIYFKSHGELRNTNYLAYNKAWVDFELTSGRWYMLASPLKGVFAGDMYLPSVGGRQETEAFQPISFSTSTNNRFNPPIYQRSWDHSSSTVFNSTGGSFDSYISANWSQVYNKVDEAYTPGKGFSIRAVYGTEGVDKVLFRLPKSDLNYSYYSYNNTVTGNSTAISRTDNGKLIFDNAATNVSVTPSNTTGSNVLFLVGNPFMATLDMKKFFDAHPNLERRYWILTEHGQSAVAIASDGSLTTSGDEVLTGTVAPMQSFFIEKKAAVVGDPTIIFLPDMTISQPISGSMIRSSSANTSLRIVAKCDGYSSNVLLKLQDGASDSYESKEDVPLIMDSNLSDSPTLYTMAGSKAVMINTLSTLKNVPFGVYSENNKDVELTFVGIERIGKLSIYDSELKKSIVLSADHCKITIPGNTHNRFFINSCNMNENTDFKIYFYSTKDGKVFVETESNDELKDIRIFGINGMLIKQILRFENSSMSAFDLAPGSYIIRAVSLKSVGSEKVIIR